MPTTENNDDLTKACSAQKNTSIGPQARGTDLEILHITSVSRISDRNFNSQYIIYLEPALESDLYRKKAVVRTDLQIWIPTAIILNAYLDLGS